MTRSGPARRSTRSDRAPARADGGFALAEAVVAVMVFAIVATVTLGLVVRTARVTSDSTRRAVASGLLTTTIEGLRALRAADVPDGVSTSWSTVGGTRYAVRTSASYLTSDGGTSACTGTGSRFAYKLVTVDVTWPAMGAGLPPVRASTLKAVGIGTGTLDQSSLGSVALLVRGYDATPRAAATVTLASSSAPTAVLGTQLTGDDGCAVFAGLAPGTYVASVSASGWVGVTNAPVTTVSPLVVTAGQITRGTADHDLARQVEVRLSDPTSTVLAGMPLRVGDSYVPETTLAGCPAPDGTSACTSGLPGTAQGLFPAVWTVKAGACTETTPSQTTVDLRPSGVGVATVPVGTVDVTVRRNSGKDKTVPDRPVTVVHGPGCSETYTIPATPTGQTTVVLPFGTWTLSAALVAGGTATTSATVTLSPKKPSDTVVLQVTS